MSDWVLYMSLEGSIAYCQAVINKYLTHQHVQYTENSYMSISLWI